MKYIISESRLDTIMKNYLDSSLLNKEIINNQAGIAVYDRNTDDDTSFWTEYMFYNHDDEDLWVNNQFIEEFSYLFNKDYEESLSFIKDWFKKEFNVK